MKKVPVRRVEDCGVIALPESEGGVVICELEAV